MSDFEEITTRITYTPVRVVGRIGYPGDRTVRYAQGAVTNELSLKVAGTWHHFYDAEAEAIALILATEIPCDLGTPLGTPPEEPREPPK